MQYFRVNGLLSMLRQSIGGKFFIILICEFLLHEIMYTYMYICIYMDGLSVTSKLNCDINHGTTSVHVIFYDCHSLIARSFT